MIIVNNCNNYETYNYYMFHFYLMHVYSFWVISFLIEYSFQLVYNMESFFKFFLEIFVKENKRKIL